MRGGRQGGREAGRQGDREEACFFCCARWSSHPARRRSAFGAAQNLTLLPLLLLLWTGLNALSMYILTYTSVVNAGNFKAEWAKRCVPASLPCLGPRCIRSSPDRRRCNLHSFDHFDEALISIDMTHGACILTAGPLSLTPGAGSTPPPALSDVQARRACGVQMCRVCSTGA